MTDELQKFAEELAKASDQHVAALADSYNTTISVLMLQIKGITAFQRVALAEIYRREVARGAAAAEAELARRVACN